MGRIARNAALCYGCKTCQLVCSLHQTGSFWPERSSIHVSRRPQTGVVRWSIDESCDVCVREEECLCVKYCAYEALRMLSAETPEEPDRE